LEKKILLKILGPTYPYPRVWIKRFKLGGRVMRTEDYFIPKKNLGSSFSRKRLDGRPQNRWEENEQKDAVFLLHVQNWKLVAQNRIRGKKLGRL
jgi:hypothetical protein